MTNSEPSSPERQFDSRLPIFDRTRQDRPQTEAKELTAFLEHAVAEVLSKSEAPPPCPRCHGAKTWLTQRPRHPKPALPVFYCADCAKHFRRTTNTPLANLKLHRAVAFLPLLSRQQSYMVAAQVLGIKNVTAMRWAQRFRAWLLQLDPSGYWEAKARLGLIPMPDIACLCCGRQGTVHYRGFRTAVTGERYRACCCAVCGGNFNARRAATLDRPVERHCVAPARPRWSEQRRLARRTRTA